MPIGDLLFVVGPPGAGKTVLALQLAFQRIAAGARVLLLTTFSESHDKLIAHLSGFDFFDAGAIGQQMQFLSFLPMLDEGVEEATRMIVRSARQQNIELVILDGFRSIRHAFPSDFAMRQFLQLLGTQLAYLGTTLVITVEADVEDRLYYSELTTADSIIALRRHLLGLRQRRLIEVRKIRGRAPLPGLHSYRIDQAGITVYPRLEAVKVEALAAEGGGGRAPFDLPGLDAMLRGGLTRATATLVGGNPGVGKTLLGLKYLLAGVAAGEAGLLVVLHESEDQLYNQARVFGLDLRAAVAAGQIHILRRAPVELDVDELADEIYRDILQRSVRRLVFDGLTSLQYALDQEQRGQDYLAAMVELLRARRVTSLYLAELGQLTGSDLDFTDIPFFMLSANMLLIRQVEYNSQLHRVISVVKARFSEHDRTIRELVIGDGRIEVGEQLGYTAGVAAGLRPGGAGAPATTAS